MRMPGKRRHLRALRPEQRPPPAESLLQHVETLPVKRALFDARVRLGFLPLLILTSACLDVRRRQASAPRAANSARARAGISATWLATISADLVRRASVRSPPSVTRTGATMYWLQQTRRAFQRQRDQRTEACRQATPAAGVGRRSWRLTRNTARTSMLSARCNCQCVPQSTRDRSLPGLSHPGARPPP